MHKKILYFTISCLFLACFLSIAPARAAINRSAFYDGGITISSPNSSTSWIAGTTHDITWTMDNGNYSSNVKIYMDYYSSMTEIAYTVNTGKYTWTIPATLTAGNENYYIIIGTVNGTGTMTSLIGVMFYLDGMSNAFSITSPMTSIPGYSEGFVMLGIGIAVVMLGVAVHRCRAENC